MYKPSYSPGKGISKENKSEEFLCQAVDTSGALEEWELTIQYTEATEKECRNKKIKTWTLLECGLVMTIR